MKTFLLEHNKNASKRYFQQIVYSMALLPLPFNETVETVGQVNNLKSASPEPELYIILNGKPTKYATTCVAQFGQC